MSSAIASAKAAWEEKRNCKRQRRAAISEHTVASQSQIMNHTVEQAACPVSISVMHGLFLPFLMDFRLMFNLNPRPL
jgi:hypothetical protein